MSGLKQIVGAAIVDSLHRPTRLLAARRTRPEHLAGLWEFPGGKVEPGEDCTQAIAREVREELGVESVLGAELSGPLKQGWDLGNGAAMRVWLCEISSGTPQPLEDHDALSWVGLEPAELHALDWIPADRPIVDALLAAIADPASTR